MGEPTNERFEIAAAVVFRLGEELITDVVQALVELVKNSYDADATWVSVHITTPNEHANPLSPESTGQIVVEDNGHGMNEQDFRRGWLMIAGSSKKAMKDSGTTTALGRTPVGDKGLGRLGVQRLGYEIEIISRTSIEPDELILAFSWKDFERAERLSEVPVDLYSRPRTKRRAGTKITVTNLKDSAQWVGKESKRKLQRDISELIVVV